MQTLTSSEKVYFDTDLVSWVLFSSDSFTPFYAAEVLEGNPFSLSYRDCCHENLKMLVGPMVRANRLKSSQWNLN